MHRPIIARHRPAQHMPCIYGLRDPRHGMICYVGQSIDPVTRLDQHQSGKSPDGNHSKAIWMYEMRQAGVQPELVILQECSQWGEADQAEKEWIRKLIEADHPILNMADGGIGTRSASKMRAARKRDWIEVGYLVKSARNAVMESYCDLSSMLPHKSKEVQLFNKALRAIEDACMMLDDRVCKEYPSWEEFMKVFYGPLEEHVPELGKHHRSADQEVRCALMTQGDLDRIMNDIANLNDSGVGTYRQNGVSQEDIEAQYVADRKGLEKSLYSCNKVCEWLRQMEPIKTINRNHSSYGLKLIAERDLGDITHGVFIAAAIHCGFSYRLEPGGANAFFGISENSIKKTLRRQGALG